MSDEIKSDWRKRVIDVIKKYVFFLVVVLALVGCVEVESRSDVVYDSCIIGCFGGAYNFTEIDVNEESIEILQRCDLFCEAVK